MVCSKRLEIQAFAEWGTQAKRKKEGNLNLAVIYISNIVSSRSVSTEAAGREMRCCGTKQCYIFLHVCAG